MPKLELNLGIKSGFSTKKLVVYWSKMAIYWSKMAVYQQFFIFFQIFQILGEFFEEKTMVNWNRDPRGFDKLTGLPQKPTSFCKPVVLTLQLDVGNGLKILL
jgi:hypothetical protein